MQKFDSILECAWKSSCKDSHYKCEKNNTADKFSTDALGICIVYGYIIETSSIKTRNTEMNDLTNSDQCVFRHIFTPNFVMQVG